MPRLVTVDGPAGSGKSSLGLRLATRLRLPFIDTGLFYRAVAVKVSRTGPGQPGTDRMVEGARAARIELETDPVQLELGPKVSLDGVPLRDAELYDPQILPVLARVSGSPAVRDALLERQRALGLRGAVAAGRDCGTVVFPDAALKIYLDAPEAVRSERRAAQLLAGGRAVDADMLASEIGDRDRADSTRAAAPLQPAHDAHIIDTRDLGINEIVEEVLALCADRGLLPA